MRFAVQALGHVAQLGMEARGDVARFAIWAIGANPIGKSAPWGLIRWKISGT